MTIDVDWDVKPQDSFLANAYCSNIFSKCAYMAI